MITIQNLEDDYKQIKDRPWFALDVAMLNSHKIRLGLFRGEYGWHKHDDADEFFLVLRGKITIQLKTQTLTLSKGDHVVIPKGEPHNLMSAVDSYVLCVRPIHQSTDRVKH